MVIPPACGYAVGQTMPNPMATTVSGSTLAMTQSDANLGIELNLLKKWMALMY